MLNELYELSRSLSRLNVKVISWHRFLKECPRGGKTFFVDVDASPKIVGLRQITDQDRLSQLRKYEKAAGYSFPSLNILPLWQFDNETQVEAATKLRKSLSSKNRPAAADLFNAATDLLRTARSLWVDPDKKKGGRDAMDKVNGCLGSVIDDLSAIVPEKEDGDGRAFPTLLGRAKAFSGELLHKQLSDWLIQQFHASPDTWVTWFDLLFFVSGKKPKASSIVFELSDQSAFDHPVNHQQVYEFVNDSGGSHPFEIRVSNGGAAYNNGVTNNGSATGTIKFEVPYNAPDTLFYQCTNHSGMFGTIKIFDRSIPVNAHSAASYTLTLSDAGGCVREATSGANITVPADVFSAGDAITIFNISSGNNTITQGSSTTLYNAADGTTGNRTLAAKGVATILCTASNEFVVSGAQLT